MDVTSSGLVVAVSSLEELRRLPRAQLTPKQIRVRLEGLGLDEVSRQSYEQRLAQTLERCGCPEGSLAGLLYLLVVPLLVVFGPLSADSLLDWALLVAGFCVALTLGKLVGLGLARWRFTGLMRDLEGLVAERASRC